METQGRGNEGKIGIGELARPERVEGERGDRGERRDNGERRDIGEAEAEPRDEGDDGQLESVKAGEGGGSRGDRGGWRGNAFRMEAPEDVQAVENRQCQVHDVVGRIDLPMP